jgi:signal transduction histidine kinase
VRPARVVGDAEHLRRMLRNLTDNAARHARGVVSMTVRTEADRVVLHVADDGSGVLPAERERVFDRFVRLDDSRSRGAGGSGLGLAIVREIVTAHEGRVTILDTPATTFAVTLPRAPG